MAGGRCFKRKSPKRGTKAFYISGILGTVFNTNEFGDLVLQKICRPGVDVTDKNMVREELELLYLPELTFWWKLVIAADSEEHDLFGTWR